MNKLSTLNYLISSYKSGKAEVKLYNSLSAELKRSKLKRNHSESEPSQSCVDTILNFASQYEVLPSYHTGNIELNLN